ncbi:zinc finger RNA-binding protein 2-like isoform X2 [Convolutriloba macropyga]|uniref:zinc finger RNA-binding protein 2-like isoform X2 n=1 Tax=Convolutriloba macropyga TaxID=536237 RepID=UPI003F5233F9
MSTFNPYQSGGATKTVVTPNFSTYSLASGYANFTPAGQAPPPPPPGSFRGPPGPGPQGPRGNGGGGGGFGRPKRPFGYDGMGYKNRMQWMAKNPDKVTRHHCEVCCCDCLGRDSWKAHLKGQQHLKKLRMAEQQGKLSASASAMLSGGGEEGEISEPGGEFTSTYRAPTVNTGRKHLTEYKMKMNPNLKVADPRLAADFKKIERIKQQNEQDEIRKRHARENGMIGKIRSRETELLKAYPGCCQVSEYRSEDDNLITAKHIEISSPPMELQVANNFLLNIETCLKAVAEKLANDHEQNVKELKGVMRVGNFAKNILLKGEKQLELVVLCDKKPTEVLAANVCHVLNEKLEEMISEEKFLVSWSAKNAWITVKSKSESALQCTVHITSPEMREFDTNETQGHERTLDQLKCAASLAETRRSKWFDTKCKSQPTLCIVVRILRDLCRRIPTWNSFPCYIIELICDTALRTVAHQMGPAELLRRFFEIIASGVLLPGEMGIYDPCEKDKANAAQNVKLQDCQDITTSSQHALRLIALGQTDKILGTTDKKRKAEGPSEEAVMQESSAANASASNSTSAGGDVKSETSGIDDQAIASSVTAVANGVGGDNKDGASPQPPPAKKECTQATTPAPN